VRLLLTKADKLIASERALALERARETLASIHAVREGQLSVQLFSATRRWGVVEAAAGICQWIGAQKRMHKKKGPGIKGSDTGPKTPCDW
jgi:GTP-binding protein EngB required for normal cell division